MASGKSFTQTDSWAVAIAFVVFAILSVLIEKAVHWLKHSLHAKKTLLKVVHKAEEELFLLGSVSFILLVFEDALVANTCVKTSRFDEETWAMCPYVSSYDSSYAAYGASSHSRRRLAAAGDDDDACDDDAEPFLSRAVLHQVHLFIFFLALAHVCYTTATLTLGRWRLRNMLRKRRAHVERTMAVVSQIASADAHVLADRMMRTRTIVMREEARPSETVRDGGGAANGEKKKRHGRRLVRARRVRRQSFARRPPRDRGDGF
jgi:mlo protein